MVRVGFPGGPRLEWYDRNPQPALYRYQVFDAAPHALVQRWSYTVPSGKKAFIEMAGAYVVRVTVATTAGLVYDRVQYQVSGGSAFSILWALLYTNTIGDKDRADVGHSLILNAGDAIFGWTGDASENGTVTHQILAKVTEFDA